MTKFIAKVARHNSLAGSFQGLRLELLNPPTINFQAGQYLILTVDKKKGIRRSYSITSSPNMNHAVELIIDIKPQGDGSLFIAGLSPGDEVEFMAPAGTFFVKEDPTTLKVYPERSRRAQRSTHELLFVATGSGIAPIRSMIVDQLITKKNIQPIRLWWGMRHSEDCFWSRDFDDLEKQHPNFHWDLVLSKPPENWPLHSGHVTEQVLNYVRSTITNDELPARIASGAWRERRMTNDKDPHSAFNIQHSTFNFYLCGSQQMINEVSTKLQKIGINNGQIHFEKFF